MTRHRQEVVLASHNAGKLAELQTLFDGLGWRLRSIAEFDSGAPPEENAPTFVENALIKARHAARVSGLPALADDSGLEVAALGGAPGVHSARYAGPQASDGDNNARLLDALRDHAEAARAARFVCLMAYLRHADDPLPVIAEGLWHGRILHNPRGHGGFGYDPLFFVPDQACSAAELEPARKNRLSHRAKAAHRLLGLLHEEERAA